MSSDILGRNVGFAGAFKPELASMAISKASGAGILSATAVVTDVQVQYTQALSRIWGLFSASGTKGQGTLFIVAGETSGTFGVGYVVGQGTFSGDVCNPETITLDFSNSICTSAVGGGQQVGGKEEKLNLHQAVPQGFVMQASGQNMQFSRNMSYMFSMLTNDTKPTT